MASDGVISQATVCRGLLGTVPVFTKHHHLVNNNASYARKPAPV